MSPWGTVVLWHQEQHSRMRSGDSWSRRKAGRKWPRNQVKRVCEQPGVTLIKSGGIRTVDWPVNLAVWGKHCWHSQDELCWSWTCEKLVRVGLNRMGGNKLDSEHTILNSFKEFAADVLEKQSSTERESGVNRRFLWDRKNKSISYYKSISYKEGERINNARVRSILEG